MDKIQQMLLEDSKKINLIMFITFSVSLVLAVLKSIALKQGPVITIYSTQLISLAVLYIICEKIVKKHSLFPYLSIVLIGIFTFIGIAVTGGGINIILITFFLAIFSTISSGKKSFILGYSIGLSIMLTIFFVGTKETDVIKENFVTILILYLLSGLLLYVGIRTFVWWYNIDSLLEGGLTWSLGGYGSPAEKPDVTTSAPPNKATIPATPYKAPKPINPLISAMNPLCTNPHERQTAIRDSGIVVAVRKTW